MKITINMHKRALTKALKDWTGPRRGDGSVARTIAALYVNEIRVPRKLREPLFQLAMACLACEVADTAPASAPSFPDLYRTREKALEAFADAVASALTKRARHSQSDTPSTSILYPPTELPCDAEGIMYNDRTREPEEP